MSWQKCPVCNGSGQSNFGLYSTVGLCGTCHGHGIISEVTGSPPPFQKYTTSTGTGVESIIIGENKMQGRQQMITMNPLLDEM